MAIKPLIGRWGQGWIRNTQDLLLHGLDYFKGLPTWVQNKASLSFSAEGAEQQGDYEAGTLYFRDSNFNRVGATFSRSTTATRVNRAGLIEEVAANVPRIDYSDSSAKLLMEPSRTNLINNSNDISGINGGSSVANAAISPDGTMSATVVTMGVGFNDGAKFNNFPVTAGTTYQLTIYYKAINIVSSGQFDVRVDLPSIGPFVSSLYTATNEWQRLTFEFTATTSGNTSSNRIRSRGANGDEIAFFGIQAEAGTYPTSYIPTAGSAVTRNADTLTATGIGSYLNDSEGALFYDAKPFEVTNQYLSISSGSLTDTILLGFNAVFSTLRFNPRVGGVFSADIQSTLAATANTRYKLSGRYKLNDFAFYANGSLVGTDTSGVVYPANTLNTFSIGHSVPTSGVLGLFDKIIIFPTALTDTELQQLTS